MSSCLLLKVVMVNKYGQFQSNTSNGFEIKWGGTKNLTKLNTLSKSKKGHNSVKNLDKSYVLLSVDGGYDGEQVW
jgi:hypothetical protein